MKKLFVCAMALAAFVSCSKDEIEGPALDSANKTVQITILNAEGATRTAYPGGDTASQDADKVAQATSLKILFAKSDGTILKELPLTATGSSDDTHTGITDPEDEQYMYVADKSNGTGEGLYTWHNVPWDVTQIAVVRYEQGDITITPKSTKLSEVEALATDETLNVARSANTIVLYATDTLEDTGETHRVGEIIYHYWDAAVTVAPALARFEINSITCTDLGNHADTGVDYSFDELDILSMIWTDEKGDTYAVPVTSKEWRGATTSMVGTLYGQYTAGSTDSDNCTSDETRAEATSVLPANGAWSWNVDPAQTQFVSMIVDMKAYAYNYELASNSTPLNIIGLNTDEGASEGNIDFQAGYVYKMDIDFVEANITDEDQLCVQVTVAIDSWKVKTVYPVFGN